MAEDIDVEAMLEAPYKKDVSNYYQYELLSICCGFVHYEMHLNENREY